MKLQLASILLCCLATAQKQHRSYPFPAVARVVGNNYPIENSFYRPQYIQEPSFQDFPSQDDEDLIQRVSPDRLDEIKWTHRTSLPSGMNVRWVADDPEYLIMEMEAPTLGYLAVGFSPVGSMAGADIFIGWVDSNGKPHLIDMHAEKNGRPSLDAQQDLELLGGKEDSDGTTIRFKRKWDTCDDKDFPIGDNTMRLIWAMNEDDPVKQSDGSFKPAYHGQGPEFRGVRSVYMMVKPKHQKFPDEEDVYPKNMKQIDFHLTDIAVPKTETYYLCKIMKMPKLDRKHHVIGFKPLIEKASLSLVHHMLIYKCAIPDAVGKTAEEVLEKYVDGEPQACYGEGSPPEWNQFCYQFWQTTAVGAEGELLPPHLGDVIGSTDGPSYYRLEVHYENPGGAKVLDSSGFRIFYTTELRKHEVSTVFFGHRTTPLLTIPPRQKDYSVYGFCPSECTKDTFPKDGIKIFSLLLHTHLTGSKITLRHIRNGKELPPIAQDLNYDFNYQQFRMLPEEKVVLPGDQLVTECVYNTADNDTFVYGGLSTRQEMCLAIVQYYPSANLIECRTQEEFYSWMGAIGVEEAKGPMFETLNLPFDIEKVPKELRKYASFDDTFLLGSSKSEKINHELFKGITIDKPSSLKGQDLHDYMIGLPWEGRYGKSVEMKRKMGKHTVHCTLQGGIKLKTQAADMLFPKYEKYVEPEKECRRGNPFTRSQTRQGRQFSGFSQSFPQQQPRRQYVRQQPSQNYFNPRQNYRRQAYVNYSPRNYS